MAARFKWGLSSVGRAPALQAGGREFESLSLHSREEITQLYLENFTQIKISEEMNISKDYRPNKPIEINNESSMLFLVITSNKGKHKVITLYNL